MTALNVAAIVFDPTSLLDTSGFIYEGVREMLLALNAAGIETRSDGTAPHGVTAATIVYVCGSHDSLAAARNAGMQVGVALWCFPEPAPVEEFAFERPSDVTRAFAAWC
jgi:hypothetical protein